VVIILVITILSLPLSRIILARPFAFGTFFIVYSIGQKGFLRGFLASLILSFFYPYLCWFYILPVALTHFVRGNKKFAIGATSLLLIFLLIQPDSFWGFQIALFKSDMVRSELNTGIEEFIPILKFYPFYLYLAAFIIFFPRFSQHVKKLNYPNILIILFVLPSLKYNRYFFDITLPLMFVSFGKELVHILSGPCQSLASAWKTIIQNWLKEINTIINWRSQKLVPKNSSTNLKSEKSLKPYIIITYLIIVFLLIYINSRQIDALKEFGNGLRHIREKSLVLTSFNLQYKTLFLRPDLRLIPSCEIGFATKTILREYKKFYNEGILQPILQKTGARYFLHDKNNYIHPNEGRILTLLNETNSFNIWKVLDQPQK
jgi:hypothetical protein